MKQPAESEVCDELLDLAHSVRNPCCAPFPGVRLTKRLVNEKAKRCSVNQPPAATRVTQPMTTNTIDLEQEYRSVRQALVREGLMIGSIDALHADWQRWVNDSKSAVGRRRAAWDVNQWWAHHLSLFRCLMDRAHLTARAVRKLKDSQGYSASPAPNSINLSEGT